MSEKLLSHRAALTNIIRRLSLEAGEIVLEYYDGFKDMAITHKEDGSPVTQADKEAESYIEEKLKELMPDVPVIGEESYSRSSRTDLSTHEYFWLVDPLDGTKSFITGGENFTTNIALIHRGEPVLGVIYAPEKEELYFGYFDADTNEGHAYRHFEKSDNEKSIRTRRMPRQGICVMTSGDHPNNSKQEEFLREYKIANTIRCASSLKMCAIANGKADLYVRFGPTGEWDTAAGHAILRAAGGDIHDMSGRPLRYGQNNDSILNPDFVAASGDLFSCIDQASQEG